LAEGTATAVAECFLTPGVSARRPLLEAVLAEDAAFALWCVCNQNPVVAEPPESIHHVARWLATQGLDALQWPVDELPLQPATDKHDRNRWSALAAESVATARTAAALAAEQTTDRSYLFGLLHNAIAWLASCGPSISLTVCRSDNACLPYWLVSWLLDVDAQPPRSFVSQIVARARGQLEQADAAADIRSHQQRAEQIRQQWLEPGEGPARLLPQIMRRLARLDQLETQFDAILETEKLESLKALSWNH
jgi:hypothetical protein